MAGRKKYNNRKDESEGDEDAPSSTVKEQPRLPAIIKPYIYTITKDTPACRVDASKLPAVMMVRFLRSGSGDTSNRYMGLNGHWYDFNGGVPLPVTDDKDRVAFLIKALKNPQAWEIVK